MGPFVIFVFNFSLFFFLYPLTLDSGFAFIMNNTSIIKWLHWNKWNFMSYKEHLNENKLIKSWSLEWNLHSIEFNGNIPFNTNESRLCPLHTAVNK